MMPETDPHEAYLDAVFAKIDRIRHINASVLTEKYGIDPAALSPVDGQLVTRIMHFAENRQESKAKQLKITKCLTANEDSVADSTERRMVEEK